MAYMTAAELRQRVTALQSDAKFPDDVLTDLVAEFQEIAERYRGVAYQPTTTTETIYTSRAVDAVALHHLPIRSVTSVTVDGTTLDASSFEVDALAGGIVVTVAFNVPVVVEYIHGLDEPPATLLRACREYVRACALSDRSSVGRDVLVLADGAGGTTRYSTPDWDAGRPTGYLEVDRLLNSLDDYRPSFA
jgi:hypothetical protein